LGSVEA
jgi:WD40 repeat protein